LQPAGLAARGHRSGEQPRLLCQLELPALLRVPEQRLVAAPPPQRHLVRLRLRLRVRVGVRVRVRVGVRVRVRVRVRG